MERNIKISILLDIYGKILTEKQYKLLDDYYNNDLSLSEIAENMEITRQAVRDNLKNGENNLFEYEKKMGLMQKQLEDEEKISYVLENVSYIKENCKDKEILKSIISIEKELNCLLK